MLSAPLRRMPSLTRNSIATVIMPLLLKPSSISFGVMIPAHRNMTTTLSMIMPGRITSQTNAASMAPIQIRTNAISNDIFC